MPDFLKNELTEEEKFLTELCLESYNLGKQGIIDEKAIKFISDKLTYWFILFRHEKENIIDINMNINQ